MEDGDGEGKKEDAVERTPHALGPDEAGRVFLGGVPGSGKKTTKRPKSRGAGGRPLQRHPREFTLCSQWVRTHGDFRHAVWCVARAALPSGWCFPRLSGWSLDDFLGPSSRQITLDIQVYHGENTVSARDVYTHCTVSGQETRLVYSQVMMHGLAVILPTNIASQRCTISRPLLYIYGPRSESAVGGLANWQVL